jgi:hypothetical protein
VNLEGANMHQRLARAHAMKNAAGVAYNRGLACVIALCVSCVVLKASGESVV